MDIHKASKLLGRKLVGKVNGFHSVSLRRRDPCIAELDIFVLVDTNEIEVIKKAPARWYGYKVYFLITKMAVFADK